MPARLVLDAALRGDREQVRVLITEHMSVAEASALLEAVSLLRQEFTRLGRSLAVTHRPRPMPLAPVDADADDLPPPILGVVV